MTYDDIHNVLVNFLQEFKREIKHEHNYITKHITNVDNAHTIENIIGDAVDYYYYDDASDEDILSNAADELLKTLVQLCEIQYVHPLTHSADMIESNPGRRFITDIQLSEFANKVGETYVDDAINKLHKEMEIEISNKLDNIINMPKVMNNLEGINAILDSDATLLNLITLCSSKVSKSQFDDHETNGKHLTDNDYVMLKLISQFINNGGIDWDAKTEDGLQAIKNKPDKLPADGGDAETVSGRGVEELLNGKKTSTIIIGKDGYGYNKDMCDYWCTGDNDVEVIQKAIDSILDTIGGEIYIREGEYNISDILHVSRSDSTKGCIIIKGCGNATILKFDSTDFCLANNVELNRLCIDSASIFTNYGIELNDSRLDNCNVLISGSMNAINNCDIVCSSINFSVDSINNMISNNRFIKSSLPVFNGDNYVKCNYEIK